MEETETDAPIAIEVTTIPAIISVSEEDEWITGWEEFDNENFNISSLDGDFEDIGEYYNVNYYPQPYCKVVNQMDFACLEMSILELWANDGKYDEATDKDMASLTNQDVLDKLNSFNKYEIIHLLSKYVIFFNL